MVKVLYVHGIKEIGGAETDLLSVIRGLDRERFQPFVVCPSDGSFIKEVEALHIPVHGMHVPAWRKLKGIFRIPMAVRTLVRRIRYWNVDVVHVNDYWWAPLSWLASRWCQVPCVVHIRQQIEPKRVKQYWLTKPNQLMPVSEEIRQVAIEGGVKPDRIQTVYSGIDFSNQFDSISGESIRQQHRLGQNQPVIGTVANLFPRKGYEFLIEAVEQVRKIVPDIFCFIVGEGDQAYTKKLESMVQDKGLQSCVVFAGFQKNILNYVAAFNVFVLPSLMEGLGIVLLEAMAMRKPIIASRVGGTPEVVEDGVTGILVSPGDSGLLADGILKLIQDRQVQIMMGDAGKKRLQSHFDLEQTIHNIQTIYTRFVPSSLTS